MPKFKIFKMSLRRRIVIASPLLITLTIFSCVARVQAQCTACPVPTFEAPRITFAASMEEGVLVVADFNNDGRPDAAESRGYQPDVLIFLNDGAGGFEPPITVPYDDIWYAHGLSAADLNQDGNVDLIADAFDTVSVLNGDGTGHFVLAYGKSTTSFWSFGTGIGDFNHDGRPDVFRVTAHYGEIFLNDGGTIGEVHVQIPSGSSWDDPTVADFNGDGNLDAFFQNHLLLGDGAGNFADGTYPLTHNLPDWTFHYWAKPYAAGDFNGDGKADIATPAVSVHLADGTGFATAVNYPITDAGYVGWDVEVGDVNGDGKLDIVTVGADKVFVLLGNGDGTFGPLISFAGLLSPSENRLELADFNGDGKLDILELGGTNSDRKLALFLNSTYQTPLGSNSTVTVNNTTFTFDEVTSGGTTTVTPIDPASVGEVPGGFSVSNSVAYEIATTATFTGSVTLAFKVPGPISQEDFNNLAILHNENGTLVDVTAATPAREYSTLTIYATTTSFSPFYLARRGPHIKSLFDQTKAYKRGSSIPIKLQVLNASNANLSSSNTSVVTRDLRLMSGNTLAPVEDSGNANPDSTFRYDSTLGGAGGGYIFNLSTKGLASGQYVLSFYVGSDRSFFYTVKFEMK